MSRASSHLTPEETRAASSRIFSYAKMSHRIIHDRVIRPNQETGINVTTCMHSWNPSIGTALDALYAPHASLHETEISSITKVHSQHVSMRRALVLCEDVKPDLVLVQRFDTIYFSDLLVAHLTPRHLYLPGFCEPVEHAYSGASIATGEMATLRQAVRSACGSNRRGGHDGGSAWIPEYEAMDVGSARYGGFKVNDLFFLASYSVASSFAGLADLATLEAYRRAWRTIAPYPEFTHFYWALHVAAWFGEMVQFHRLRDLDFSILRLYFARVARPRCEGRLSRNSTAWSDLASWRRRVRARLSGAFTEETRWMADQCPRRLARLYSVVCDGGTPACAGTDAARARQPLERALQSIEIV